MNGIFSDIRPTEWLTLMKQNGFNVEAHQTTFGHSRDFGVVV